MRKTTILLSLLVGFGLFSFASNNGKLIESTDNKKNEVFTTVKKVNPPNQCFEVEYLLSCGQWFYGNYCFTTPSYQSSITMAQWQQGWVNTNAIKCGTIVEF